MIRQIGQLIRDVRWLRQKAMVMTPGPWVPLTLKSGFTASAGYYTPSIRIVGDKAEMCGGLTGTIAAGGTIVATVVAPYIPASPVIVACGISGGTIDAAEVYVDGSGNVWILPGIARSAAWLDGVSFRLT
jgi:hypothetical protein